MTVAEGQITREEITARARITSAAQRALKRPPMTFEVPEKPGEEIRILPVSAEQVAEVETWKAGQLREVKEWGREARAEVAATPGGEIRYEGLTSGEEQIVQDYGIEEVIRRRTLAAEAEAVVEMKEVAVQLPSGEWIDKESYGALGSEAQVELRRLGLEGYNRQIEAQQAEYETFVAANVEIAPDQWIPRGDWAGLSPSQKEEVRQTGHYTVTTEVPIDSKGEEVYEVDTPKGKVVIPASKWEDYTDYEKLTIHLGREPTLAEATGYVAPVQPRYGGTFGAWTSIPVLGGFLHQTRLGTELLLPGIQSPVEEHFWGTLGVRGQAQAEWYKQTYGYIPTAFAQVSEQFYPAVRFVSPKVTWGEIQTGEKIQTAIAGVIAAAPFARLAWARFVTPKLVGIRAPLIRRQLPITGLRRQSIITTEPWKTLYTPGGKPLVTISRISGVRPPVTRITEGFYTQPLRVRPPVSLTIGRGLQRAGLTAEVERAAFVSGQAARGLSAARTLASRTPITSTAWTRVASRLQTAQQASLVADTRWAQALAATTRVTPRGLRLMGRVTGVKGLTSAIKGVSKASEALESAWKVVESRRLGSPAYIKSLKVLERAQIRMEGATAKFTSTLAPRFQYGAPPMAFKGYQAKWTPGYGGYKPEGPTPFGGPTPTQKAMMEYKPMSLGTFREQSEKMVASWAKPQPWEAGYIPTGREPKIGAFGGIGARAQVAIAEPAIQLGLFEGTVPLKLPITYTLKLSPKYMQSLVPKFSLVGRPTLAPGIVMASPLVPFIAPSEVAKVFPPDMVSPFRQVSTLKEIQVQVLPGIAPIEVGLIPKLEPIAVGVVLKAPTTVQELAPVGGLRSIVQPVIPGPTILPQPGIQEEIELVPGRIAIEEGIGVEVKTLPGQVSPFIIPGRRLTTIGRPLYETGVASKPLFGFATSIEEETRNRLKGLWAVEPLTRQIVETQTRTQLLTKTQLATKTLTSLKVGLKTKLPVRPFPFIWPSVGKEEEEKPEVMPPDSAHWQMGVVRNVIPPPYSGVKPYTEYHRVPKGQGSPYDTFVPSSVIEGDVDWGVTDIEFNGGIKFTGYGEGTDVGVRDPSKTKGMTIRRKKQPVSLRF